MHYVLFSLYRFCFQCAASLGCFCVPWYCCVWFDFSRILAYTDWLWRASLKWPVVCVDWDIKPQLYQAVYTVYTRRGAATYGGEEAGSCVKALRTQLAPNLYNKQPAYFQNIHTTLLYLSSSSFTLSDGSVYAQNLGNSGELMSRVGYCCWLFFITIRILPMKRYISGYFLWKIRSTWKSCGLLYFNIYKPDQLDESLMRHAYYSHLQKYDYSQI